MPDLVATDRSFGTTYLTGACAGSSVLAATGARALSDFDLLGNRSLCAAEGDREEDEAEFDRDDDDDFDDDDLDDDEFLDDEDDEDDEDEADFDEDDGKIETDDDEKL